MSSSQYVASLTNGTIGTLYFSVAKTDGGRVADRLKRIYEELRAKGVDGRRWRLENQQFPDFAMQTWADFATYSDAVNEARRYDSAHGAYMNLLWAAGGFSPQPYINIKVVECRPIVIPAFMGGYGTTTGTTAAVTCSWTLAVQAQEGVTP